MLYAISQRFIRAVMALSSKRFKGWVMDSNFKYLKAFEAKLLKPKSIDMSLNNVHCKGLFSLVIDGFEHGKLLRVFIAHKKIKAGQIQYHSHRYPIKLTVLSGEVVNHVATQNDGVTDKGNVVGMDVFKYQSPLNHGNGLSFEDSAYFDLTENTVPKGCSIHMNSSEIHTVSCSKGSIWIVEEQGFQKDSSVVLGVPFTTKDLYQKPEQFQINSNWQLVRNQLDQILNSYIGLV